MTIQPAVVKTYSRISFEDKDNIINCEEKLFFDGEYPTYYFQKDSTNVFREVMLPAHVDPKFSNPEELWTYVSSYAANPNQPLLKEVILPYIDNPNLTLDHRIEMAQIFSKKFFVSKGFPVQLDIHQPHDDQPLWMLNILIPMHSFNDNRNDLDDVDESMNDFVGDKTNTYETFIKNQFNYYASKYITERVNMDIIKNQKIENEKLQPQTQNQEPTLIPNKPEFDRETTLQISDGIKNTLEEVGQDVSHILDQLTQTNSLFSQLHVEQYLNKNDPAGATNEKVEKVLNHESTIKLHDPKVDPTKYYYTTCQAMLERDKVLLFAKKVHEHTFKKVEEYIQNEIIEFKKFSDSQKNVFENVCNNRHGLILIQGRAGTGKTYVLDGLRQAYETPNKTTKADDKNKSMVIGLAPTNKVAYDLKDSGFENAYTVHKFLFDLKNKKQEIGANITIIVDEAAMLSNEMLIEILYAMRKNRVILVGDDRQLTSVNRGGMFDDLCKIYGSVTLSEVRRQKVEWQRQVSEFLSNGDVRKAITILKDNNCLSYHKDSSQTQNALIQAWQTDLSEQNLDKKFILAATNIEVDALNLAARDCLKKVQMIASNDYLIQTLRGAFPFAIGDRIQIAQQSKDLNLINGAFGTIRNLNEKSITLEMDCKNKESDSQGDKPNFVTFNPSRFQGLRHGYAGTVYKAQGATIDSIFFLHSVYGNSKSNYVALTRQSESLKIFIDQSKTGNDSVLANQLSRMDSWKTIPLNFVPVSKKNSIFHKIWTVIKKIFFSVMPQRLNKINDLNHSNPNFYKIKEKPGESFEVAKLQRPNAN